MACVRLYNRSTEERKEVATEPLRLLDPPDLEVSGEDQEALVKALVAAYPAYGELEMMVRFRLDLALQTVAPDTLDLDFVAFKLVTDQLAKGHFLRFVAAARASRPGNPKLARAAERFALAMATAPELERVVSDSNSYLDIATYRGKLGEIEGRVCRVEVDTGSGTAYGTGFLVGADLVLTNHHVVQDVIAAAGGGTGSAGGLAPTREVLMRFDYKIPWGGTQPLPGVVVRVIEIVDHSPYSSVDMQPRPKTGQPLADQLDYALLRLETPPGAAPFGERPIGDKAEPGAPPRGAIPLPAGDRVFEPGAPLVIVQHPDRAPMKLAIESNAILEVNANGTRVTYRTNTDPGSSGSPCFNQNLDLVALHHAGDPRHAPTYHPEFNEGIPIAAVRDLLRQRGLDKGLSIGEA